MFEKLENMDWVLVGSLDLALQGVDVEPRDIDILTDENGAFLINDILKEYETQRVEYSESDKFASYFGKFRIDNVKIDVMGDLRLKDRKGNWSKPMSMKMVNLVKINGIEVPCLPLEDALIKYRRVGRFKKAKKIEETLKKHKPRIKAVFFDIGNTLVTSDDFMQNKALGVNQELLKSIGHNFSTKELKEAHRKAVEYTTIKYRGSSKVHEKGLFMSVMCKFLGLDIGREVINKLHEEFQKRRLESYKLRPHTKTILSFLKNKYKLAIISNGSIDGINRVIDMFDLRKYFDLIIISEEIGKEKSTTIPIKVALDKLGLKPDEVIMIGDRIDEDVLGAKKLGMISIHHNYGLWKDVNYSGEDVKPDFIINKLSELRDIIEKLEKNSF